MPLNVRLEFRKPLGQMTREEQVVHIGRQQASFDKADELKKIEDEISRSGRPASEQMERIDAWCENMAFLLEEPKFYSDPRVMVSKDALKEHVLNGIDPKAQKISLPSEESLRKALVLLARNSKDRPQSG